MHCKVGTIGRYPTLRISPWFDRQVQKLLERQPVDAAWGVIMREIQDLCLPKGGDRLYEL